MKRLVWSSFGSGLEQVWLNVGKKLNWVGHCYFNDGVCLEGSLDQNFNTLSLFRKLDIIQFKETVCYSLVVGFNIFDHWKEKCKYLFFAKTEIFVNFSWKTVISGQYHKFLSKFMTFYIFVLILPFLSGVCFACWVYLSVVVDCTVIGCRVLVVKC
jgi:hypothetical protein